MSARHTDPLAVPRGDSGMSPSDRIRQKVVEDPSGCWIFTGAISSNGYGIVEVDGRARKCHRVMYEAHVGPIPDGLVIDHLCRRTACCNPAHLEAVTQQTNTRRGVGPGSRYKLTHCHLGHEFTPDNTYNRANGTRACRRCAKDTDVRRKARDRAARQARREALEDAA